MFFSSFLRVSCATDWPFRPRAGGLHTLSGRSRRSRFAGKLIHRCTHCLVPETPYTRDRTTAPNTSVKMGGRLASPLIALAHAVPYTASANRTVACARLCLDGGATEPSHMALVLDARYGRTMCRYVCLYRSTSAPSVPSALDREKAKRPCSRPDQTASTGPL
ncbi:hypothetical protein LY76DRAFT_59649 [Colletotrichum caudatum]|nr:hypothetical protein LY76DRAFT_59649 [Colletotrichum caudatum]